MKNLNNLKIKYQIVTFSTLSIRHFIWWNTQYLIYEGKAIDNKENGLNEIRYINCDKWIYEWHGIPLLYSSTDGLLYWSVINTKRSLTFFSYKYVSGSQLKFLLEGENMKYLFMLIFFNTVFFF